MSWPQEIELWISLLTLGEPLQKLLSIAGNELSRQFDHISVNISQDGVRNGELVWCIRL
jgi:hypothetical protein